MTRRPKTVEFWYGRLPHWEVEEGLYFVTVHLAGAIPLAGRNRILMLSREQAKLPKSGEAWLEHQRRMFGEMERWLDRAEHALHLAQREVAQMVVEAIRHREARGDWRVFEFVVMPNHVHLFFELLKENLKTTMNDFKRWTGHEAGKLLRLDADRFWQREWFDHWSRSDEEDDKIIRYIRDNPVKRGLVAKYCDWPYGSWAQ
jgi:REP element-mobilizing transposase RayT